MFSYSGCAGNSNNFLSRSKCQEKCSPHQDTDQICSLEVSPGDCSGLEIRYYYDIETEDCQPFNFTGCGANQNNFKTLEACLDLCVVSEDV